MSYYAEEDFEEYEAPDELALKIRELVTEEVKSKIKQTVEGLEEATKTIASLSKKTLSCTPRYTVNHLNSKRH